ncbi:MAG TPA: glycosyltransferase [Parafilimonas sp.]|nr:glycosyltransferase [Parafilimonas sp.]
MNYNISVVIPTYKRPELVVRCLAALARQNYPFEYFEIIVVTDGPDDRTKKEVSYFKEGHPYLRINFTSTTGKKGPAAARNRGASLAKGELLVFTDDDCIPQCDWLRAYWSEYQSSLKSEIAFTGRTIVPHSTRPTDYEKNIARLQTAEFITANCACSKQAFETVGGFDEEFPVAWREDSEMQFKLMGAEIPIRKINDAVVLHPVRKAHWGISLKEQKKSMFNALLFKKHPLLYKEKISGKPLWNYYAMVLLVCFSAAAYASEMPVVSIAAMIVWAILVAQFTSKRLKGTSKKFSHVAEMLFTSALIPFLSVYWTLYGAFRYKTILL